MGPHTKARRSHSKIGLTDETKSVIAQAGRPGIAREMARLADRSPAFRPGLSRTKRRSANASQSRKAHSPDNSVAILDSIRRIVRALRVGSRLAEKSVGLSGAQLFVLQALRDKPAASINDLAALTRTHQSSVSVVVQRLVDRQLIHRSPSAKDARRLELSLTPAARRLIGKAPDAAQNRLIAAIDSLPAGKRASLSKLLGKLVKEMGEDSTDIEMFFEENHAR